jgi:hypothetical protein
LPPSFLSLNRMKTIPRAISPRREMAKRVPPETAQLTARPLVLLGAPKRVRSMM